MQPHLDLACVKLDNTQEELKISQYTTSNLALRVKELENQLEFPPYMWTVTNFWETVSRAKNGSEVQIESDSFYLGLHGYKMKLRMYPNGIKGGINFYTSLMKGKYDAILPWPFLYEVKFTVIDQNPDLKRRKNLSSSLRPNPLFSAMQRPKVEENDGQGLPTFLSHAQLRNSSYVVDETLFIKFEASRCKSV